MIKPGYITSILKNACVVAVVLIGKEQNVLNLINQIGGFGKMLNYMYVI